MTLRSFLGDWRGRARRLLARSSARGDAAPPSAPNAADAWEDVYGEEPQPVRAITTEVARHVLQATEGQRVLLEAGVGTACASAELALAGREVILLDFSERILERARRLFAMSGLPAPRTILADLTQPLPLDDLSVDVVWSSGTLEHWTTEEVPPILREMARVSRDGVLAIVPRASCLFYRWGKHAAERAGRWPYGREIPRETLVPEFARAGLEGATESTLSFGDGLGFLRFVDPRFADSAKEWWSTLDPNDPVRAAQGSLLSTLWRRPPPSASPFATGSREQGR